MNGEAAQPVRWLQECAHTFTQWSKTYVRSVFCISCCASRGAGVDGECSMKRCVKYKGTLWSVSWLSNKSYSVVLSVVFSLRLQRWNSQQSSLSPSPLSSALLLQPRHHRPSPQVSQYNAISSASLVWRSAMNSVIAHKVSYFYSSLVSSLTFDPLGPRFTLLLSMNSFDSSWYFVVRQLVHNCHICCFLVLCIFLVKSDIYDMTQNKLRLPSVADLRQELCRVWLNS